MVTFLKDSEGTVAVMDDVLVYGQNEEEHNQRLCAMLQTIKNSGLKLNRDKCHFGRPEIQYFGQIISQDGIKPDPSKVKAVTNMSSLQKTSLSSARCWE